MKPTLSETLDQMELRGGSFAQYLAKTMRRADSENLAILKAGFATMLGNYEAMAELENKKNQSEDSES